MPEIKDVSEMTLKELQNEKASIEAKEYEIIDDTTEQWMDLRLQAINEAIEEINNELEFVSAPPTLNVDRFTLNDLNQF